MSDKVKKIIFISSIGIAVLIFFIFTGNSVKDENNNNNTNIHATIEPVKPINSSVDEVVSEYAVVDVKGEVNKPGVYEVPHDSRVHDVIELAGGFTDDAEVNLINLAQKIQDEMSIVVSKTGEEIVTSGNTNPAQSQGKVRINYATVEEIQTLNGIGPSKAQAIVQYREEHGLFQRPEELLDVSGIGEKTLQNFMDQIQIP